MAKAVQKTSPNKSYTKSVTKQISKKKSSSATESPKKAPARKVPFTKLYNGKQIPMIGLGTFGSDHMSHYNIGKAVKFAIENGYRLIDCAKVYCNESFVGNAMKKCI
jgi:aromatic ring-opening dioxygenase catalytic subunit (LigB family)